MPEALESGKCGRGTEPGWPPSIESARLVNPAVPAHNFLDFDQFFATVRHQVAGLVFAFRPPIFCRPAANKPVSNPKAF